MRTAVILSVCFSAAACVLALAVMLGGGGGSILDPSTPQAAALRESLDSLRRSADRLAEAMSKGSGPHDVEIPTAAALPPVNADQLREVVVDSVAQALGQGETIEPRARPEPGTLRTLYEERAGQPLFDMRSLGTGERASQDLFFQDYTAVLRKLGVPKSVSGDPHVQWSYERGFVVFVDGRVSFVHIDEQ